MQAAQDRPPGDVVSFGGGGSPGRARWSGRSGRVVIAALGVVLAAGVVAGLVTSSRHHSAGSVASTSVGHRLLDATGTWQLVGSGPDGLVQVQPARGLITRTSIAALRTAGVVALAASGRQVELLPLNGSAGFVVRDGQPARRLSWPAGGAPQSAGAVGLWVWVSRYVGTLRFALVPPGLQVPVPSRLLFRKLRVAGGQLVSSSTQIGSVAGIFSFQRQPALPSRPKGLAQVKVHSWILVGAGPVRALGVGCWPRPGCALMSIDSATGRVRFLASRWSYAVRASAAVAPDGLQAAMEQSRDGVNSLVLMNLSTGAERTVPILLGRQSLDPQALAWSPDSRWLFVALPDGQLVAVNGRSDQVTSLGVKLPPITSVVVSAGTAASAAG